jgi:hypothetical protein
MKTRADLFEAAAKMMRMADEHNIGYFYKQQKCLHTFPKGDNVYPESMVFSCPPDTYEFFINVVEGKPVFDGDELYAEGGSKFTVTPNYAPDRFGLNPLCSWLYSAPKSVMVELLREDAERLVIDEEAPAWKHRVSNTIRKELEK